MSVNIIMVIIYIIDELEWLDLLHATACGVVWTGWIRTQIYWGNILPWYCARDRKVIVSGSEIAKDVTHCLFERNSLSLALSGSTSVHFGELDCRHSWISMLFILNILSPRQLSRLQSSCSAFHSFNVISTRMCIRKYGSTFYVGIGQV